MDLIEKISSEEIFNGRILHVRRDTVRLPNGGESFREVVDHPGGVCILALDSQNRALLVSQFRYPYEEVLRELPAGKLEYGEDPREAAIRELKEETGAVAGESVPRLLRGDHPDVSGPGSDLRGDPSGRGRVSGSGADPLRPADGAGAFR